MISEILKILWWVFFAIVKFIWTPFTLASATDYLWWEALLITVGGGWLGIAIFFYFGKLIINFFSMQRGFKGRRKFTRMNRFIIRIKNKYGLVGLTSIIAIISVPICSLLAAAYFKNNKRVVPALFLSVLTWASCLTCIFYLGKSLF
ncbi:MAG TPA: hypothetical protein EYM84_00895 [Flavobacteriales bacterium]|nr:hypothetical protein [Flavobacteriales bacterium]HIN38808.1 hypothetical protein [Flavobacteriales bacterium]